MNLLFVADELAPVSGGGAAGRLLGSLTAALSALGHKVTVCAPLRDGAVADRYSLARRLSPIVVELPGRSVQVAVFDGRLPSGVEVRLLAHDELFDDRSAGPSREEALRLGVLARAALQVAGDDPAAWHVLHGVGLPGALACHLAREGPLRATPSALHVTSMDEQGRFDRTWVEALGLSWDGFTPEGFELFGDLCLLKAGLVSAGRLLLPAPSVLLDARNEPRDGLEGVVRVRGTEALGILPGLDCSVWNPTTDSHLAARYDAELLSGKLSCKADLQNRVGLPVRGDVPLVAVLPPLDDLAAALAAGLDRVARAELQLVAPRGLARPLEARIDEALAEWPDRVARIELDDRAEHLLLAGADMGVLDAPRGLEARGLLAALRYGALPVTRPLGLARDLVVDLTASLESGNGYLVHGEAPAELVATLRRAAADFRRWSGEARALSGVAKRAMAVRCSWEDVARRVEQVHAELLDPSALEPCENAA